VVNGESATSASSRQVLKGMMVALALYLAQL